MWDKRPSFRFEIDNFSKRQAKLKSQNFVGDGYEWFVEVYPKGNNLTDDHMSLYLSVPNPQSLPNGWNRRVRYYFSVLNNSDKELHRSSIGLASNVFCAGKSSWGFRKVMPLSRLREIGVLEKDRLIIEVYIKVVEAVEGVDETVDINGFQVLASQAGQVTKIFTEHPGFAKDLKPKNQVVKTEYMNVVLKLTSTLQKPLTSLSETELREACTNLNELMDLGFKVEWLTKKIEEVYLERKKSTDADGSLVQQLKKRVKRECVKRES